MAPVLLPANPPAEVLGIVVLMEANASPAVSTAPLLVAVTYQAWTGRVTVLSLSRSWR